MKEGYKKTELGVVPINWDVRKLGELFDFKNGLNKEKVYFGKGTKIINYTDVFNNRGLTNVDIVGLVTVSKKEIERFNCKKGDVFFTRTSETIDEIGMTSVLLEDIDNLVFSGFVLRARPINEILCLLYKKYCFSEFYVRKEIKRKSSCTTRALTSGTLLKDVYIRIPPLPEQQKIASILSTVDQHIEETDALIEKTKELKKGLMQKLLTKGIGHTEFKKTEVGEIPVEWEIHRLEEICDILDNLRKPIKAEEREKIKGNIPYYGASGIIDYINMFIFDKDIILLGEDGENLKSRNVPLAFKVSQKCWVNNHAHVFSIKNNMKNDIDFITFYLENKDYTAYIAGSAQPKITQAQCRKILLPIPKIEEQKKISNVLLSIDKKIEQYIDKKQKLQTLKKGLMQQLLTGKKRVI